MASLRSLCSSASGVQSFVTSFLPFKELLDHLVFDFNMTEPLGKQTLDLCESFVQLQAVLEQFLSKQCFILENLFSAWT